MRPAKRRARRARIMGVLNVTPDSFSDGGDYFDTAKAVRRGIEMAGYGADIIDVGGESTRPGAAEVSAAEEMARVVPVIKKLSKKVGALISIDTRKAIVAEEAVKAGAGMINDISGLVHDPAMAKVAARYKVPVIIMHMRGTPLDMQKRAVYRSLIADIISSLKKSITLARRAGIKSNRIIIDPGIGFAKKAVHNLIILNRLAEFKKLGYPICVGVSRKSFIGKVLGIKDPLMRSAGTLAANIVALVNGADILRVHDVKEAFQALKMAESIAKERII